MDLRPQRVEWAHCAALHPIPPSAYLCVRALAAPAPVIPRARRERSCVPPHSRTTRFCQQHGKERQSRNGRRTGLCGPAHAFRLHEQITVGLCRQRGGLTRRHADGERSRFSGAIHGFEHAGSVPARPDRDHNAGFIRRVIIVLGIFKHLNGFAGYAQQALKQQPNTDGDKPRVPRPGEIDALERMALEPLPRVSPRVCGSRPAFA